MRSDAFLYRPRRICNPPFAGNGGQVFPYDIIDPFVFLDMTGGVMPIVLLTSDTDLVAEYNYRTLDERAITDFFNH